VKRLLSAGVGRGRGPSGLSPTAPCAAEEPRVA
jgi:hypothetical protein